MTTLKRLLVLFALTGCAATPARDANLVLQRMHAQLQVLEASNEFAGARTLVTRTRDEYQSVIGESIIFDRLTVLMLEAINLDEEKVRAIKNGSDPAPYLAKRGAVIQEIRSLVPHVKSEIQHAQQVADRRAENATALVNTLGIIVGGVLGAAAASGSPSASTYQATAPTPPAPTNCTAVPAGHNTVTGQSYGSYIYCR